MSIAAIWDMDGTLVDTAELHFRAWQKVGEERDRPFTRDDFTATFGRRNPEIIRSIFGEHLSDQEVIDLGNHKERYYRAEAKLGIELLPGARELLERLHQAGVPQAIGSSAPRDNLELILELTETTDLFDAIVSAEDVSKGKPDPEVFLKAAEKLEVPPAKCVVFEDAVAGVQAATTAGMKCVAVRFVGHHPAEALREAGADVVVECLSHVATEDIIALGLA